ncbi:MAG: DUF1697 domain-containing protein [Gemmatimonadales bacterium]
MALVVFLRGVNVGGHRTFRPSQLAQALRDLDVVNIGAAGTFVVRKRCSQAALRAELRGNLPFETEVMVCEGRDLLRFAAKDPFGGAPALPGVVRFVSVLAKVPRGRAIAPLALPAERGWLLRVVATQQRFVFGMYRRHMKTIGYLGKLDKLFGVPATTRNWNTIMAIVQVLKGEV